MKIFVIISLLVEFVLFSGLVFAMPPSSPMTVVLSISSAPALNQTANLTSSITSLVNATNTSAEIILSDGFVLEGGNLSWYGNIADADPQKSV